MSLPAASIRPIPAGAASNVVSQYGADPTGTTDSLAAFQAAVAAGVSTSRPTPVYVPNGTYLWSGSLLGQDGTSAWLEGMILQGQSRDGVIIKLADGASGFGDPANPKAMIVTGSHSPTSAAGGGNEAFFNTIRDLTLDVGNNAGAIGLDYIVSNWGELRDVIIRDTFGVAQIGLAMQRDWPGPGLLKRVGVYGFAKAIAMDRSQYHMTMHIIDLAGYRTSGISTVNGSSITLETFTSSGAGPAVQIDSLDTASGRWGANVVIDGATMTSTVSGPAILNSNAKNSLQVHNATRAGSFTSLVSDNGTIVADQPTGGYVTGNPTGIPPHRPLPTFPEFDYTGTWVQADGGNADGAGDLGASITTAVAGTGNVLWLAPGAYNMATPINLSRPLTLFAVGNCPLNVTATAPTITVSASSGVVRIIGLRARTTILHTGACDLLIQHCNVSIKHAPGAGRLFLEDVAGGNITVEGGQVFGRQVNPEGTGIPTDYGQNDPLVNLKNASAVLYGLKTEKGFSMLRAQDSTAEIFGGAAYPTGATVSPLLDLIRSDIRASLIEISYSGAKTYPIALATEDGLGNRTSTPRPSGLGYSGTNYPMLAASGRGIRHALTRKR